jgi:hypothetical protein
MHLSKVNNLVIKINKKGSRECHIWVIHSLGTSIMLNSVLLRVHQNKRIKS